MTDQVPRGGERPFLSYELPEDLIAQTPIEPRDRSHLLVVRRATESLEDRVFHELPELLEPGDLLVLNDTRVIPARLMCRRRSGGRVELLLLERREGALWQALVNPLGRLRSGEVLVIDGAPAPAGIEYVGRDGDAGLIEIEDESLIERYGQAPLPPYIHARLDDPERYQTVYSAHAGSAAAPTAGLHFTEDTFERCRRRDIEIAKLTLHVGVDTFRPLPSDDPAEHRMHSEWFSVPDETLNAIERCRDAGKRVVAVGTTATRVLETLGRYDNLRDAPRSGRTQLFIYPPYRFEVVGGLITNFHLPRTSLLLLVGAFTGSELLERAYQRAIERRYRFYSFGDAMLIV